MTNRMILIGWLIVATGLALCWYPLKHLKGMQIGSPQLLFYAFSSASLCSLPWLSYQVKQWRSRTQYLLQIGLTGAVATTFLHFSLLSGEPQAVFSIFCLVPVVLIFVQRVLSTDSLNSGEFLIFLMIVIASLVVLLGQGEGLSFNWSQLMALIASVFCYLLFRQHNVTLEIPLASKLSAILICSTWLIGMVVIFSPRFVSFPQENAVLASVLYGVLCISPILLSALKVLQTQQDDYFQLWLVLLLVVCIVSTAAASSFLLGIALWFSVMLLLISAFSLLIKVF